jgi:maltose alpha-D-glucosyltransferase / alpha-amylase
VQEDQTVQRYVLPLALAWEGQDEEPLLALAGMTLARVRHRARVGILYDAFGDNAFCNAVLRAIGVGARVVFASDALAAVPTRAYPGLVASLPAEPDIRRLSEANNNVVVFGERLFLKGFRRLRAEVNLDLEMGRFLTEHAPAVHVIPVGGAIELQESDGTVMPVAVLQGYVENQGDAWSYTQAYLERFLTRSLTAAPGGAPADAEPHAGYCLLLTSLGRRTAELHAALAAASDDPAFAPEPISPDEPGDWANRLAGEFALTLQFLQQTLGTLPGAALTAANAVLAQGSRLPAQLAALGLPVAAMKTRLHGYFHLGQVLIVGSDVMLTGFGSGPAEGLQARRTKGSPLKDVAGLLCSLDNAAAAALIRLAAERPEDDLKNLDPLARAWAGVARDAFMAGYRESISGCPVWPAEPGAAERLLALFSLERIVQELQDALTNRPEWVQVPLERLLEQMTARAGDDVRVT